jgi:AcrR family transcriptional regulator
MARPKAADSVSRARIVGAAAAEFAARGYAGANMDRIARAARLNKAMIYYHFASKAALYHEILNDMFGAVRDRVAGVAASAEPPAGKIRQYIAAIAGEAEARPHFPSIWLREIAEGGEHIDRATVGYVQDVLGALRAIIDEGIRDGRFQPINPMMLHGGIVAPLMFFFATARVRRKLDRRGALGSASGATKVPPYILSTGDVVAHIQQLALAQLEGRLK